MLSLSIINSSREYCQSLQASLKMSSFYSSVNFYTSCDEAIKNLPKEKPDIILMDIEFPVGGIPGPCAVKILLEKIPRVKIIVLTNNQDKECLLMLIGIGVHSFIGRDTTASHINASVKNAICDIDSISHSMMLKLVCKKDKMEEGKKEVPVHLSPQQLTILNLLEKGYSYKQIAERLNNISVNTVKKQIQRMYRTLGVHNMREALKKYKQSGNVL